MKIFKKMVMAFLAVLILVSIAGYLYFDQKFTPEKNYLTVKNESGKVPIVWLGNDNNVLLVPVHFPEDPATYYLQFDTGSPSTLFYTQSIKNIKAVSMHQDRAKASFTLGKTQVSSDQFMLVSRKEARHKDTLPIIGTLGVDILENNKTLINFKENYLAFNLSGLPSQYKNQWMDFTFKKRKIIIKGMLKGKEKQFLFDSGTSAYELLTNKEEWENLKSAHSKVTVEKARSWQNILTTYTAACDQAIQFQNKTVPLHHVTYVEGFSQTQYTLMKLSGMTGMLGNKIFLKNVLYLDGQHEKMAID